MDTDHSAPQPLSRSEPVTERDPHVYLPYVTGQLQSIQHRWMTDTAYSEALRELDEALRHLKRSWQALPGR